MHLRTATLGAVGALLAAALLNCGNGGAPDGAPDARPDSGGGGVSDRIGVGFLTATSTAWESTGTWPIEIAASSPLLSPVTFSIVRSGGTAAPGKAILDAGTITLAAGQKRATALLRLENDTAAQPATTVELTLTIIAGSAELTAPAARHTVTLRDDDARLWPGDSNVAAVDAAGGLGGNLSGLTYQAAGAGKPAYLWAVKNGPSLLYRLEQTGALWAPSPSDGWAAGKTLRYPGGTGSPDAEGVARAGAFLYVATERDNDVGNTSRLSVLRYDPSGAATTLTATHEWNLTADLPAVDPNAGFEAITWIPDSVLVSRGFLDEKTGKPYAPADYPDHGEGLFAVGLEGNGMIYVYALDHAQAGKFTRLASFASGNPSVMGLEQDGELLWTACDNGCQGAMTLLSIDDNPRSPSHGRFVLRRRVDRPTGMPDLNNEGIALPPDAECAGGRKPFLWSDDAATGGNALRQGSVACGAF